MKARPPVSAANVIRPLCAGNVAYAVDGTASAGTAMASRTTSRGCFILILLIGWVLDATLSGVAGRTHQGRPQICEGHDCGWPRLGRHLEWHHGSGRQSVLIVE